MSTSTSSDETFEVVMKNYQSLWAQNELLMRKINEGVECDQELQAQNDYLRKQLWAVLKQKRKMNEEPSLFDTKRQEQVFSHNVDSSNEDEPLRMTRTEPRFQANPNDFRDEIPEFEGKVDPEDFLDWLHRVARVFK